MRKNYASLPDLVPLPSLTEVQRKSYDDFLQKDLLPEERKDIGLQSLFNEIFPVVSTSKKLEMHFVHYSFGVPKYNILECKRRKMSYQVPLKVTLRIKGPDDIMKEQSVHLGRVPLMTEHGTFIINGVERVIVSQLQRSPGISYEQKQHPTGVNLPAFTIIPYRGTWLEATFDLNDNIFLSVDRRHKSRKILVTTLLRALGFEKNEQIASLFYKESTIRLKTNTVKKRAIGKVLSKSVKSKSGRKILAKSLTVVTDDLIKLFTKEGIDEISCLKNAEQDSPILKMLEKEDFATDRIRALQLIYMRLQPGEPVVLQNAENLLKRLFFDKATYDLGKVGRYKFNKKLGFPTDEENLKATTLSENDIVTAVSYLLDLHSGNKTSTLTGVPVDLDDIDHLGNRRVRSVGELAMNQCRIALLRLDKYVRDRMSQQNQAIDIPMPEKLVNPRILTNLLRDFFGSSQLSQFMDQLNPLAELTHKRRLSALGPGGLNRDRAGFKVRDVHSSHYGRICPIETPEGANIGLISSMSTYAVVNNLGFIETPYVKVEKGVITGKVVYLTADAEEKFTIAQANAQRNSKGKLTKKEVMCRKAGNFVLAPVEEVQYIDVSPKQIVSIAAGIIPFLEHDDANRALMGSNMQRQAVPLMVTEQPLVGTGMEEVVARESGALLISDVDGEVIQSDAKHVLVDTEEGEKDFLLRKHERSNADTSINQRPLVKTGDKVKTGDVLADGSATCDGELALGKNVLVAFMPWEGYNFEDAILVSERLLKEDYFTSIHINHFDVTVSETKLGREETTRDIPNESESALSMLDAEGIVLPGTEVHPGDILVGKITPKSEAELTPEQRLLMAIFGDKATDIKNASLKASSGTHGIVMHVDVFRRRISDTTRDKTEEKKKVKRAHEEFVKAEHDLIDWRKNKLTKIFSAKIKGDVIDEITGEILASEGEIVSPQLALRIERQRLLGLDVKDEEFANAINRIHYKFEYELETISTGYYRAIEYIRRGDELEHGVLKIVRVYIAIKQKLQVGDKMAGRHGNKGVISKIMPQEDMPYLEDGTPVDIVLNPLGVPSRMNVGQILETHLGWAAKELGMKVATPVFDGISEKEINALLKKAKLPEHGKVKLIDGRTGDTFKQTVTVGYIYMMKLGHLVATKIHARATGPYSLVTQQPLGGKAQYGGQRLGEMEVWALEAYGAAYTLQELLTVKSDDVDGRLEVYSSIVNGDYSLSARTPESFNVLVNELKSACLDIRVEKIDTLL
ncbi:MAG: DNA-directed RNA polymerase subunit beta [Chlamydiae bacterium]|nr:MAG: DNA-directed RNA polymerase subunit beta [Chlamydiota bacterium]